MYGHFDDAERFAFFSRAVLEMLPFIDFQPNIIHCNDWQTARIPIYYHLFYGHQGILSKHENIDDHSQHSVSKANMALRY
ncbi:MAG: glycogen/starch synthase [Eubacteriales bacterium]